MKKYTSIVVGGVLYCCLVLMIGCASSNLTDIWSDSSFQSPPLNNILVLSVSKDQVYRHMWEDVFSAELTHHNIAATPSYSLFPNALTDTSQVQQIIKINNFDGILVYRRLLPETKSTYRQGFGLSENNTVYDPYHQRFVASYFIDEDYASHVDTQKTDIRDIELWTTKNDGRLIWRATSRTPEPNTIQDVRPEIAKLVIVELTKQRIIASER